MYLGAPGVIIQEKDNALRNRNYSFLTSIIVDADRGPTDKPIIINSPKEYDYYYGNTNNESRKYVLSFLQYSPGLLVLRSVQDTPEGALPSDPGTYNASSTSVIPFDRIRVDNLEQFYEINSQSLLVNNDVRVIARTPGSLGNNLQVAIINIDQWKNNVLVYSGNIDFHARQLVREFGSLDYCVIVFRDRVPVETFVVPFDDVNKVNELSNEIYLTVRYEENLNELHDGDIQFFDGNFGFFDGNVFNTLQQSFTYFGNSIINLEGGESLRPLSALKDSAESLFGYDVDLHIAYNVAVPQDDVINIVSVPMGVEQAKDFVDVYNTLNKTPKMYIYGIKKVDKEFMGLEADYAGLRSKVFLEKGVGISSSSVNSPFNLTRLITKPSIAEMDSLYFEKINIVNNYKGIIYCNGELLS